MIELVEMNAEEYADFKEWRRIRKRLYEAMKWRQTGGPPFVFDRHEFKAARDKLGMSRREVAETLEIHINTIWKWETGEMQPTRRYRERVTMFLVMASEVKAAAS